MRQVGGLNHLRETDDENIVAIVTHCERHHSSQDSRRDTLTPMMEGNEQLTLRYRMGAGACLLYWVSGIG